MPVFVEAVAVDVPHNSWLDRGLVFHQQLDQLEVEASVLPKLVGKKDGEGDKNGDHGEADDHPVLGLELQIRLFFLK